MQLIWAMRFESSGRIFQAQIHLLAFVGKRMFIYVQGKASRNDIFGDLNEIAGPLQVDIRLPEIVLKSKLAWLVENPEAISAPQFIDVAEVVTCLQAWHDVIK